jgi:hemoglobin-like flavoprotein
MAECSQLLEKGDTDTLTTELKSLAARHVTYGVHPSSYTPVGLCVLHAFSKMLPEEEWTEEAKKAWIEAFSLVCQVMIPVHVEGWWTRASVSAKQLPDSKVKPAAASSESTE